MNKKASNPPPPKGAKPPPPPPPPGKRPTADECMAKHDEHIAELAARIATKATVQLCCDRFYDELVKIFTYTINEDVFFAAEDAQHIKDLVYNLAEKYGDTIREHGGLPPEDKWQTGKPPEYGWYLVTLKLITGVKYVTELKFDGKIWAKRPLMANFIAWTELPEPYKGEP